MFRSKTILIALGIFILIYFLILSLSFRGWGYAGYGGFHHGPAFLYFGGPSYYTPSPSVRPGSMGGPSTRGGGFRGGK